MPGPGEMLDALQNMLAAQIREAHDDRKADVARKADLPQEDDPKVGAPELRKTPRTDALPSEPRSYKAAWIEAIDLARRLECELSQMRKAYDQLSIAHSAEPGGVVLDEKPKSPCKCGPTWGACQWPCGPLEFCRRGHEREDKTK